MCIPLDEVLMSKAKWVATSGHSSGINNAKLLNLLKNALSVKNAGFLFPKKIIFVGVTSIINDKPFLCSALCNEQSEE